MGWLGLVAAFAAFVVKGVAGFANTLVFTSILSFQTVNRGITPVDLLLGVPANLLMAWKGRRHIRPRAALPLIAMQLAGSIPGMLFLRAGDDRLIKRILGVCILLLAFEMLWRILHPVQLQPNRWVLLAIGIVSGFLSGLFGVGAFLVAYVGRTARDQDELRGTLSLVFVADNLVRIPLYIALGLLDLAAARQALLLAPGMALGLGCGFLLAKRIPERTAKLVTVGLLVLMGISVLAANI